MTTLPGLNDLGLPDLGLPDLGAGDSTKLDLGNVALPALASLALGSRGGGGGLLKGFMQGMQLKLQRQGRADTMRREFLVKASAALGGIEDPDQFEETKTQFKGLAEMFGVKPEELDTYAFPASKKKAFGQKRAAEIVDRLVKLHGADQFAQLLESNASVEVDGQSVPLKSLWAQSGAPKVTRTVTRSIFGELPAPEVTGTGPGLAQAGLPQRGQTGTEQITEEVPFRPTKRLTLAEYDPRFVRTVHARTPVPLTKDGDVDVVALSKYYDLVGARNPTQEAKDRLEGVQKERDDVRARMAAIQDQMNGAKTEAQFKAAVEAWNTLVNNVHKHKPYLGFTQVPFDVPSAVKQWLSRPAGDGTTLGPPTGGSGQLDVRPVRDPRGVITHYSVNGQQFTVQQVRQEAARAIADGDPNGAELAAKVGITRGQVLRWIDHELRSVVSAIQKAQLTGVTDAEAIRKHRDLLNLRRGLTTQSGIGTKTTGGPTAPQHTAPPEVEDPLGIR